MSANSFAVKDPERQRAHAQFAGSLSLSKSSDAEKVAIREKISESLQQHFKTNGSHNSGRVHVKLECPWCGKMGAKNVIFRWHFDNCKK